MTLSKKISSLLPLSLCGFSLLYANTSGLVGPPQSSAGIIEKQIQKEYQVEDIEPARELPLLEVDIPTKTLQIPSGQSVAIQHIVFKGNLSIPSSVLQKIVAPYLGKSFKGAELKEICHAVQAYYIDQGYILARVFPPMQEIQNQTLVLEIMEGILGHISIEGNKYYKASYIKKQVRRFEGQPVNYNKLIRTLLLLNENMDLSVGAIFKKGQRVGEVDVILVVKDRLPFHIYTDYNNYGSTITTDDRLGTRLDYGNFITYGDRLSLVEVIGIPPAHLNYSNAVYSLPVSPWGTKLEFSYLFSQFKVGEFGLLDLKGESNIGGIKLNQALTRSRKWSSDLFVAFNYLQLKNEALGQTSSYDKLRILQLGGKGEYIDSLRGKNIGDIYFSAGIPDFLGGLDAIDSLCSREGAGGRFFIGNLDYQRIQLLPWDSFLLFSVSGQGTFNKLPISQQFYIGGIDTVRGYPLAVVLGDNGYYASLELSIPPPFLKKKDIFRIIGFLDHGGVFDNGFVPGENDPAYLTSAGIGFRVQGPWNFFVNFDAGFPLTNPYKSSNCITYFKIGLKIL